MIQRADAKYLRAEQATHRHGHSHGATSLHASRAPMVWALSLTTLFALIEAAGGWWSGSLALLSDAGHMLTDGLALGLALFAQTVARRPPSDRNTFGYARAEVLGAFVNAVFMLLVVVLIAIEALQRLLHPEPVQGGAVMLIAAAGLAINLVVARMLHGHHEHDINRRAAYLHVLGDVLGSVAALLAGAVIWLTGWLAADPILSLVVVALMVASTWRLLRQSTNVLMEGVPSHLSYPGIGQALAAIPGVQNVHDLHIWHMSSERVALSAHVMIDDPKRWPAILAAGCRVLRDQFSIEHVTLQPGWPGAAAPTTHRVIPVAALERRDGAVDHDLGHHDHGHHDHGHHEHGHHDHGHHDHGHHDHAHHDHSKHARDVASQGQPALPKSKQAKSRG